MPRSISATGTCYGPDSILARHKRLRDAILEYELTYCVPVRKGDLFAGRITPEQMIRCLINAIDSGQRDWTLEVWYGSRGRGEEGPSPCDPNSPEIRKARFRLKLMRSPWLWRSLKAMIEARQARSEQRGGGHEDHV